MIGGLLPPQVMIADRHGDDPDDEVFPGEEDLIAHAAPSRRREFVAARRCAREALARLGCPGVPIRSGPGREPLWPAGVVGSITHCAGYRAAAVARSADLTGLGLDAEPHAGLPPGVLRAVAAAPERDLVARLSRAHPATHWDRLLFSAKESVFKAWYPLTGRRLGFHEVRLRIGPPGSFTARVLAGDPPIRDLRGRYAVADGLILTAVGISRGDGAS